MESLEFRDPKKTVEIPTRQGKVQRDQHWPYREWIGGKEPTGNHVKKRQKSSKSVKNIFENVRHFSRRAKTSKIVKKCQKFY